MLERLLKFVLKALGLASDPIRQELVSFAKTFRAHAKATPNPYDDFLAEIICWILDVE